MSTLSGIVIGLLAGGAIAAVGRSRSKKEIDRLKRREKVYSEYATHQDEKFRKTTQHNNEDENYVPADIAFKENLNKFAPLLKGVSKQEIANRQEWTEAIVSINNEELTKLWKAANKRPDLWVTYLQTFGLQMDWVDIFEASEYHKEMYDDESGSELQIGKNYKVISACWIFTDDDNMKSVASKGVASKNE